MNARIATCALAAVVLAGCATTSEEGSSQRVLPHEREYATGSNMPRRPQQGPANVTTVTREDMERSNQLGPMPGPNGEKKW